MNCYISSWISRLTTALVTRVTYTLCVNQQCYIF